MTCKGTCRKITDFFRTRGRKALAAVFLATFLLGYNLTLSRVQYCRAEPITPAGPQTPAPPTTTPFAPTIVIGSFCLPPEPIAPCSSESCEPPGTSQMVTQAILQALYADLTAAANLLENWVYTYVQATLQSEYIQLDWLERSMISWWQTMWYYNLLPSYQQMTRQLNVELALQTLQLQANADASASLEMARTYARHGIEDQERHPGEQVCVAATQGGGFTRATVISRAILPAWESKSLAPGLNQKTDPNGNPYPGAGGAAGFAQRKYDDWRNIFCDANGNGQADVHCGNNVDANLINMDVLPVKYLFNNLTINVDDKTQAKNGSTEGKNMELGLEYLINNLVGVPALDAIAQASFSSPAGQQGYLLRRSYLARYAAVRSIPDMVAGWRMPGSHMGKWVADLRRGGGVPAALLQDTKGDAGLSLAGSISKNPSYKEIMHALSIDRFNSGMYAKDMLTDPAKVEMEKLNISVFYLMQLRDYYELLERTALTLAVQVSVLADGQMGQPPNGAAPLGAPAAPGG